jgi:flagellar hook assembly protein FlgD
VYPNPFRPSTTISFALAQEEHVRLEVYNAQGALVRTVLDGPRPAGRYDVVWNARNDSGNRLGSGVYFVRLTAGTVQEMRKIVMLR